MLVKALVIPDELMIVLSAPPLGETATERAPAVDVAAWGTTFVTVWTLSNELVYTLSTPLELTVKTETTGETVVMNDV